MGLPKFSRPKFSLPKFSVAGIPLPAMSDELRKRVISAGILAPIILIIIFIGNAAYNTLIVAVAVIMSFEWQAITHSGNANTGNANTGNANTGNELAEKSKKLWYIGGIAYITIFASSLIYLRSQDGGIGIVLFMLFVVWATDIAAFFTGRALQGPKICVRISPNKTWAGLIGGMIAAGCVGAMASVFSASMNLTSMVLLGAILAVVAQAGDFFESWLKRRFGVKDSGTLIPGHGGLMDRLDGFTTVAPVLVLLSMLR